MEARDWVLVALAIPNKGQVNINGVRQTIGRLQRLVPEAVSSSVYTLDDPTYAQLHSDLERLEAAGFVRSQTKHGLPGHWYDATPEGVAEARRLALSIPDLETRLTETEEERSERRSCLGGAVVTIGVGIGWVVVYTLRQERLIRPGDTFDWLAIVGAWMTALLITALVVDKMPESALRAMDGPARWLAVAVLLTVPTALLLITALDDAARLVIIALNLLWIPALILEGRSDSKPSK